jgi:hypothetical protein
MADIGARLRDARLRARIDIDEVEARTKIRAKYLRAMENDEWDLLPGEVYARSFLRTYGQFLGLDTRALIDEFRRLHERPSDHELRPIAPRGRDRERGPRGPLVPPWLVIAGVLVAVVVALVIIGTGSKPGSSTSTQSLAIHHAQHRHHAAHSRPRHHTPVMVRLQLVPTAAVYVCLVDGNGKRLIPGVIYNPGQTIPEKTASKMLLTLGNASVQMKVNGVAVPLTPSSNPIGYELLPGSHHLLPASAQPRCA